MQARAHRRTFGGTTSILVLLIAIGAALAVGLGLTTAGAAAAPAPGATDVMFVFDTSGSMGGELEEAKSEILTLIAELDEVLPSAEFGVSEVRDYPREEDNTAEEEKEAEESFEKPFKLDQPMTASAAAVKTAIEPMEASGGGDAPESYGRALWEADTNPDVGWRSGARHEIVLIADNVPHDNDLDEGIPESEWASEGKPAPWNTGEEKPGKWGIPGTIWTPGTNLDFQTTMKQLGTDEKPLEMVDFKGEESGYLPYWEYWASLSGGHALIGKPASKELASALRSLIETGACTGLCAKPVHPTSTLATCTLVVVSASDTCTATVTDIAASGKVSPTGTVTFTSASGGVFSAGTICTLVPSTVGVSACSVQFLPPTAPSPGPTITASYGGDARHTASGGASTYGPAGELISHFKLSGSGTILPGGKIEVPIECGFPCAMSGSLFTGPGLAKLASLSATDVDLFAASSSSHGKKKKKAPVLLGKGTLKLPQVGKGELLISLSGKAKHALTHVGKKGVRVTLKVTIDTASGTLVTNMSELVTLKPKPKKTHH